MVTRESFLDHTMAYEVSHGPHTFFEGGGLLNLNNRKICKVITPEIYIG